MPHNLRRVLLVLAGGLVLALAIAYLLNLRSPGITPADQASDNEPRNFQAETSAHPYRLKTSNALTSQVRSLLLVYSIPAPSSSSYNQARRQVDFLEQAIKSYWGLSITAEEMKDYRAGNIDHYDSVLVVDQNREVNSALEADILNSKFQNVVWQGFSAGEITSKLLYEKSFLPPELKPNVHSVQYKGRDFPPVTAAADHPMPIPDGVFELPTLADPHPASSVAVLATYVDMKGNHGPFAVEINDRFLILPFTLPTYYRVDNASLVFLDVLHNAFGHKSGPKQALLRLEAVDAYTYSYNDQLSNAYAFLKEQNIPFQVALTSKAVVPAHKTSVELADRFLLVRLLKIMNAEGLATFEMHGYTQQVGSETHDYSAEFWNTQKNVPLANDTASLVNNSVRQAQDAITRSGLPIPDIWTTPGFVLSELDNNTLRGIYPLRNESVYGIGELPFAVQFEGSIYIPENLGYFSGNSTYPGESFYTQAPSLEFIKRKFYYLSAFEDPVVSLLWSPWQDSSQLNSLVTYFHEQGYGFVGLYGLLDTSDVETYAKLLDSRAAYLRSPEYIVYHNRAPLTYLALLVCIPGCLAFVFKKYITGKYYTGLKSFDLKIGDLEDIAHRAKRELPNIAILVPARNEGRVIANTLRRLSSLDYPKARYLVIVIVDERELDDNVDQLTKDVVTETEAEIFNKYQLHFVEYMEVPKWYSGSLGSWDKTYERSTKGRALNYALQRLESDIRFSDIEMFGVLDADGRPDKDVLKEVAYKRLVHNAKLLQGPVFQVSNFSKVNWVGIFAGLELASHHLTELPLRLLRGKVQFLAGTNYYIDRDLMVTVGGWDQKALVEDAELALRIYMRVGVLAEWLSCPEVEQTPPNFGVYRRQRERWVRGHLYLILPIINAKMSWLYKLYFLQIIVIAQFRFILDIALPVLLLVFALLGTYQGLPPVLNLTTLILMLFSIFIWDDYGAMYRRLSSYIDSEMTWRHKLIFTIKLFLLFPAFAIVQAVPRVHAFYNLLFKSEIKGWYKTERTKEVVAGEL